MVRIRQCPWTSRGEEVVVPKVNDAIAAHQLKDSLAIELDELTAMSPSLRLSAGNISAPIEELC
jgi:hypothetical protein